MEAYSVVEMSRIPHCVRFIDGGVILSLTRRPRFTPKELLVIISVRG
jgi:hypothetical protein